MKTTRKKLFENLCALNVISLIIMTNTAVAETNAIFESVYPDLDCTGQTTETNYCFTSLSGGNSGTLELSTQPGLVYENFSTGYGSGTTEDGRRFWVASFSYYDEESQTKYQLSDYRIKRGPFQKALREFWIEEKEEGFTEQLSCERRACNN